MKTYLETLFRVPLLLILPALLLPVLVFAGAHSLPKSYKVDATLWVDSATQVQQSTVVATASDREASAFDERLATLAFRKQVLTDAGLADSINALQWPPADSPLQPLARHGLTRPIAAHLGLLPPANPDIAWQRAAANLGKSLTVVSRGNNLVFVSYSGGDAQTGLRLVQAAVTDYLTEKANAAQLLIDDAQKAQDPLVSDLQNQANAAHDAYLNFVKALPATTTPSQDRQTDDLQFTYEKAVERLQEAQLKEADDAQSTLSDPTTRGSVVTLVDAPALPTRPELTLKKELLFTILAGMLGLALGAGLIVLRTWLDRRLHAPADIETQLAAPVLGVVPLFGNRDLKGTGS